MATDDTQRILDWCSADDGVRFVEERSGPGAGSTLLLESGGAELTATLGQGDRLHLRSVIDLRGASRSGGTGDLAADLVDLEERRPGPVTAELDPDGEHASVATWVVLDGLTKHSFLTGVSEITRTRGAVLRLAGLAVETAAADAEREPGGVAEPGGAEAQGGETQATEAEMAAEEAPAPSPWGMPAASIFESTPAAEAEAEEEPVAGTPAATPAEEAPVPSPWETPATSAFEPAPAVVEEPAAETPAATPEEGAPVPSPWETPAASAFEPAPAAEAEPEEEPVAETPAAAPEEREPAPSTWAASPATSFEPATSSSQQPWAAPGGYGSTPSPVGPVQPFSGGAAGQGQGYAQGYGQTSTPAPSPAPAQQAFTFAPTHRVPPQGMQAWAAPDPAGAVIATLGGHLPVQVTEVRGAWAHVLCSNGWTGWVDDRLLVVGA